MADKLQALVSQGKQAFDGRKFDQAAEAFSQAASEYEASGDALSAAEMRNNLSVALLQGGKAPEAYEAVTGTEEIFARAGDVRREAMAAGNLAAALEALKRKQEALEAYERSAHLFAQAGEHEMRSLVLQSAAKLKLQRGAYIDSAMAMIGSAEAAPQPNLLQRLLKFLIRIKP